MPTIAQYITNSKIPAREAKILWQHILRWGPAQLISQSDCQPTAEEIQKFQTLEARRLADEPIAYIIGSKEFYGRSFLVSPDVLIPRPETEQLIDLALKLDPKTVLDLGTGSGAIAITLSLELASAQITALDVSQAALTMAVGNADQLNAPNINFLLSDLLTELPDGSSYDLITANLPYISTAETDVMGTETLKYEPELALFAGDQDGLSLYKRLFDQLLEKEIKCQHLLCEIGYQQGAAIQALAKTAFGRTGTVYNDLNNHPRIFSLKLC